MAAPRTKQDRLTVVETFNSGIIKERDIAKATGFGRHFINEVLHEAGLDINCRRQKNLAKAQSLSLPENTSVRQLAKNAGVNRKLITQALNEKNIVRSTRVKDNSTTHRTCGKCRERLPLDLFAKNVGNPLGYSYICRECNKKRVLDYNLKKNYGITLSQYNQMIFDQNNGCAICGQPEPNRGRLCVDHCHTTGKVRGLLCVACNFGIGALKDSATLVQKAADYLKPHCL